MSVEARLQALVQNYRAQYGDAPLRTSAQLIANLSSQAPDLHGEIRALAAAIGEDAAQRIARAGADGEGEAGRIATEIAGRERLSLAVVTAGISVARVIGPITAASVPPPTGAGDWAGESVIVQPAALPPPNPPPPRPTGAPYFPPGSPPPFAPGAIPQRPNIAGRIALGIGGFVVLALGASQMMRGIAQLGGNGSSGNRPTDTSVADWDCARIATKATELSQTQPARFRDITNVREASRTATDARCEGTASLQTGESGTVYMRAYQEGTNIMVAYQGEPFPQ